MSSQEQSKKTIVVADDDEGIAVILRQVLEDRGYIVHTASDGRSAVQIIEEVKPDLVVLDILMPTMPGYDVCSYVRNQLGMKDVKILMLSALTTEPSKEWAKAMGADYYLTKPFLTQELVDQISTLLKQ